MKGDKPPCGSKKCGHGVFKHYDKGKGACSVLGCVCDKYKS